MAIHIPSGAVGEVYKIYLPPPPEGETDEEEEADQSVSCLFPQAGFRGFIFVAADPEWSLGRHLKR